MNRAEVLEAAKACVIKDRDDQYGPPEDSFFPIARLWNAYLWDKERYQPREIKPHDVAAMLALMKIARIAKSPGKADHWIDLAGYAACGGEVATK